MRMSLGEWVPRGAERAVAREHRKGTPATPGENSEFRTIFRESDSRVGRENRVNLTPK